MKIEKINDSQVKFIINEQDLADRDIEFQELEYGSAKAHELFREMMEQAHDTYGFQSENAHLMVEAIPITSDTLMVIVTRVTNMKELTDKLGLSTPEREELIKHAKREHHAQTHPTPTGKRHNIAIYYFNTLDDVIDIAKKVNSLFIGKSAVYKHNQHYYLILEGRQLQKASYLLSEYGQYHAANTKSKYYLMEHGETIVAQQAIQKLASM